MLYLATFAWGWILGAGLIGLATGWIAVVHRARILSGRPLALTIAAIIASIVASALHILPGRFGYWLDLALVMFAAYLIGCAIGSWLRHLFMLRLPAAN